MENTRRNFAVSLAVSMVLVWIYFGYPTLGGGPLPLAEGSLSNSLAKMAAIPLTLAIFGGGGLAAASALGDVADRATSREVHRRRLALTAPPGIAWIVLVAATAFPMGLLGDLAVLGAGALSIFDILRNTIVLGVFRHRGASGDCRHGGA